MKNSAALSAGDPETGRVADSIGLPDGLAIAVEGLNVPHERAGFLSAGRSARQADHQGVAEALDKKAQLDAEPADTPPSEWAALLKH